MACFIVPTTAAIIISAARKKIPRRFHINWFLALLWGGIAWLIPEHIYHGEVVLYPPFFTAGFQAIISEIIRVGVPMVMAAFALWIALVAITSLYRNKRFPLRFFPLMLAGAMVMILVDKVL